MVCSHPGLLKGHSPAGKELPRKDFRIARLIKIDCCMPRCAHHNDVVVGGGGSQVGGQPRDLAVNVRRVQLRSQASE